VEQEFADRVPNTTRVTIKGIGHFVQEEVGAELAALMNDFIAGRDVQGF
jgi:pimeloyl-ACP methyl ester carboxylesterase